MKKAEKIKLLILVVLIISTTLLIGFTMGYFQAKAQSFSKIEIIDEVNPGITTIKLLEVKGGKLIGKISGRKARLAYNPDNILELDKESEFEIPLNKIRLKDYYVADTIPEGILYIASKNGKYYYSIVEKKAFNLSQKNRVYFKTSKEAEAKGYLPSK